MTSASRAFGRDGAGRLISVNRDDGSISFVYDDKNQVVSSTGGGMGAASFACDVKGRMTLRTESSHS